MSSCEQLHGGVVMLTARDVGVRADRSKGQTLKVLTLAFVLAACGDQASAPSEPGLVRVTVAFTGTDFPQSYVVRVGPQAPVTASPSDTAVIVRVHPGSHRVELLLTARNCQVADGTSRTTSVRTGETTTLAFSVACSPTTGSVSVTSLSAGVDLDRDGYSVRVVGFFQDGKRYDQSVSIGLNATVTLSRVPVGEPTVIIQRLALNCDTDGSNPRTIKLEPAATAAVTFNIACVRPRQLAYVRAVGGGTDLYITAENTTGERRLTSNPGLDEDPAWSPDGRKLAFTTNRDGNREIYVMDADGSNAVRLTHEPAADYEPTWSPDGSRIAFVSERERAGDPEIYVMHADGSNTVRLTNNPADDWSPAWSPDGSKIAFTSDRDRAGGVYMPNVYIMNADGSGTTRLTGVEGGQRPAWSPDGTKLAYSARFCPSYYSCYSSIFIRSGAAVVRPTRFGAGERPSWSPDGRKIAFNGFACDYYNVRCDLDAIRIGRVDDSDAVDVLAGFNPAWRP